MRSQKIPSILFFVNYLLAVTVALIPLGFVFFRILSSEKAKERDAELSVLHSLLSREIDQADRNLAVALSSPSSQPSESSGIRKAMLGNRVTSPSDDAFLLLGDRNRVIEGEGSKEILRACAIFAKPGSPLSLRPSLGLKVSSAPIRGLVSLPHRAAVFSMIPLQGANARAALYLHALMPGDFKMIEGMRGNEAAIRPWGESGLSPEESAARIDLLDGSTLAYRIRERETVARVLVRDRFGRPALVLALRSPLPDPSEIGLIWGFAFAWLAVFVAGPILGYFWLTRRGAYHQIRQYIERIQEIRNERCYAKRLAIRNRNEVSNLGFQLNGLMEEFEYLLNNRNERAERYRTVIKQTSDGIFLFDLAGKRFLEANPAFRKMLGYQAIEIYEKTFYDMLPLDRSQADAELGDMLQTIQDSGYYAGELRLKRKDQTVMEAEITANLVQDKSRKAIIGVARDITERKKMEEALRRARNDLELRVEERTLELSQVNRELQAEIHERIQVEAALKESEERYRRIVSASREGICTLNADAEMEYVNQRMADLLGYSTEELIGRSLFSFLDEETRADAEPKFKRRKGDFQEKTDYRLRRKNGSHLWAIVSTHPMTDDDGAFLGALSMVTDITERKALEELLMRQARYDALTHLPNRAYFMEKLKLALIRAAVLDSPLAALFLDLDGFKNINDSLGHKAGDQLLIEIGNRIVSCLRKEDVVARLGGDEFTLLIENVVREEDLLELTERIIDRMRESISLDGHEVFISASIGIVFTDGRGVSPEDVLRDADLAMYEAKNKGKACYAIFNSKMTIGAIRRLDMETDLRRAIDRGELRVHYQPVVNLKTGRVRDMEALARWEHPKRGLVPASDFIPLAEETGLIHPIGMWVLKTACAQLSDWRNRFGMDQLMVSVNFSARQFRYPCLVEEIAGILEETGLNPRHLKVEVTESAMLEHEAETLEKFWKLRKLGIQISMDDFGTGYSALNYVKKLPLDTLKIDRSFVWGLGQNEEDTAIVSAVIAFADALKLNITGEGIENYKQMKLLKDMGCHQGQGYFFSKPLPAIEMEDLLRDQKASKRLMRLLGEEDGDLAMEEPMPLDALTTRPGRVVTADSPALR